MKENKANNKTDWTDYYSRPKSRFSEYTQKYTFQLIIDAIKEYCDVSKAIKILELGGGNSCFAKDICNSIDVSAYDIIDSNDLAVERFNAMNLKVESHRGYLHDLTVEGMQEFEKYDFVFSIGLIEHFKGNVVDIVIGKHFEFCSDGGVVFISFPTPTRKYLFVRRCMEMVNKWQFYDETPLRYDEVKNTFEHNGKVLKHFINKKLPLTQMVVIINKRMD